MRTVSAIAMVAIVGAFPGCRREEPIGEATATGAPMNAPATTIAEPAPAVPAMEPGVAAPDKTPAAPDNKEPNTIRDDRKKPTAPQARGAAPAVPPLQAGATTTPEPKKYPCAGNQVSFRGPAPFCANVCRTSADCPNNTACDGSGTSVDRNGLVAAGSMYCSATKK